MLFSEILLGLLLKEKHKNGLFTNKKQLLKK